MTSYDAYVKLWQWWALVGGLAVASVLVVASVTWLVRTERTRRWWEQVKWEDRDQQWMNAQWPHEIARHDRRRGESK